MISHIFLLCSKKRLFLFIQLFDLGYIPSEKWDTVKVKHCISLYFIRFFCCDFRCVTNITILYLLLSFLGTNIYVIALFRKMNLVLGRLYYTLYTTCFYYFGTQIIRNVYQFIFFLFANILLKDSVVFKQSYTYQLINEYIPFKKCFSLE